VILETFGRECAGSGDPRTALAEPKSQKTKPSFYRSHARIVVTTATGSQHKAAKKEEPRTSDFEALEVATSSLLPLLPAESSTNFLFVEERDGKVKTEHKARPRRSLPYQTAEPLLKRAFSVFRFVDPNLLWLNFHAYLTVRYILRPVRLRLRTALR